MAAPGSPSSINSPRAQSAPLWSLLLTRRSFTSEAARGCIVPISPLVTASTSRPTAEKPGRTSAYAMASRFPRWRLILATQIVSSLRSPDILTAPILSVAFIARRMAPRRTVQPRAGAAARSIPTQYVSRLAPCLRDGRASSGSGASCFGEWFR